ARRARSPSARAGPPARAPARPPPPPAPTDAASPCPPGGRPPSAVDSTRARPYAPAMNRSELVEELERLCAEAATARERLHGLMNAVAAVKETLAGAEARGRVEEAQPAPE